MSNEPKSDLELALILYRLLREPQFYSPEHPLYDPDRTDNRYRRAYISGDPPLDTTIDGKFNLVEIVRRFKELMGHTAGVLDVESPSKTEIPQRNQG